MSKMYIEGALISKSHNIALTHQNPSSRPVFFITTANCRTECCMLSATTANFVKVNL